MPQPENILFTSDGHVKIADFGSAKMLRSFTNGIITCDPGILVDDVTVRGI